MTSRHAEEVGRPAAASRRPQDRASRHPRSARGAQRPGPAGPTPCATSSRFVLEAEDDSHVYFVESPRPRGLPEGHAHRRLRAAPGAALLAGARGGAHLGDPGRRRALRLPEVAPRHRRGRRAAPPLALRLRRAGRPLRAPAHARAAVAAVRGARRRGGDRAARADPRPRLRALHELRQHERGGRAGRGPRRLSAADPGRGTQGPVSSRPSRPDPGRRALRHLVLLAGGRRGRRPALLRHHRQAALRLARRPVVAARIERLRNRAAIPSPSTRCRWRAHR